MSNNGGGGGGGGGGNNNNMSVTTESIIALVGLVLALPPCVVIIWKWRLIRGAGGGVLSQLGDRNTDIAPPPQQAGGDQRVVHDGRLVSGAVDDIQGVIDNDDRRAGGGGDVFDDERRLLAPGDIHTFCHRNINKTNNKSYGGNYEKLIYERWRPLGIIAAPCRAHGDRGQDPQHTTPMPE
ncbi:hypothetical protein PG995_014306 [Apiospora arundinis]